MDDGFSCLERGYPRRVPDLITLVEQRHDVVGDRLARVEELGRSGLRGPRHRVIEDLVDEVRIETRVKRNVVLPVLVELMPGGPESAAERTRELDALDESLERRTALSSDDPPFEATVRRVVAEVKDHVATWERDVFPALRRELDPSAREELGEGYERAIASVDDLDERRR